MVAAVCVGGAVFGSDAVAAFLNANEKLVASVLGILGVVIGVVGLIPGKKDEAPPGPPSPPPTSSQSTHVEVHGDITASDNAQVNVGTIRNDGKGKDD